MLLERYRTKLNSFRTEYQLALSQVKVEKAALAKVEEKLQATEQAQKVIQEVAEKVQQQAHRKISSVVSRCLEAVFGEDAYEFRVIFEQKRGKTEARLIYVRNGQEIDPTSSSGGGVIDVTAFALRLSCLMLARPKRRRLLCLDEPWKHLSSEYRPAVRELVESLAKDFNIQFLIVTHSPEFKIGNIIELERS